jgi:hypothetical protein
MRTRDEAEIEMESETEKRNRPSHSPAKTKLIDDQNRTSVVFVLVE